MSGQLLLQRPIECSMACVYIISLLCVIVRDRVRAHADIRSAHLIGPERVTGCDRYVQNVYGRLSTPSLSHQKESGSAAAVQTFI